MKNVQADFTQRYARMESLEPIGKEGVEKIGSGRVFVIGCGALGSMCAMYLAGAGVGTIGIADYDTIDISNLQRQLFYSEKTAGASKVMQLAKSMNQLNSEIDIRIYNDLISAPKALKIFGEYDFIIDGSDNAMTKQMTSRVCENLGIPYCIGGVEGFTGQVMSWSPGHAGYRELFGESEVSSGILPCSANGVIGPAAGVVASYQASEAIKFFTSAGDMLYDKLFSFDLLSLTTGVYDF